MRKACGDGSERWKLIDQIDGAGIGDDPIGAVELLVDRLATLPVEEIHAFQDRLAATLFAIDGEHWWGDLDRLLGRQPPLRPVCSRITSVDTKVLGQ